MPRDTPYGAYNFLVDFGGPEAPGTAQGGFSDVSGLGTEITLMEYRQGNDKENRVRKIPALHKASDVTLKRGIMGLRSFWDWIDVTRGLRGFGIPRPFIARLFATWPDAGFHWRLVTLALDRFRRHPLTPLPMVKL